MEIHDLVYVKNTYGNRKLRTVVPSRGRCSSSSKVIFSSLDSANVCCGAAADMLQLNRVEKGAVGAQAHFEHNGRIVPLDQKPVTANFDLGQVATSACTICWASEEHSISCYFGPILSVASSVLSDLIINLAFYRVLQSWTLRFDFALYNVDPV